MSDYENLEPNTKGLIYESFVTIGDKKYLHTIRELSGGRKLYTTYYPGRKHIQILRNSTGTIISERYENYRIHK